jgi:uncharacterized repeat protein (TIGR01451 family)
MPRRLCLVLSAGLLLPAAAFAQRGGRPYAWESPEPPLADEAGAVQPTAAREPRPLAATVRQIDSAVPIVQLFVRAPTVLPVGQDADVRLVVENSARVPARNVVVVYTLPDGVLPVKPTPGVTPVQGGYSWKVDQLDAGARRELMLTLRPPPGATELDVKAKLYVEQEQAAKLRFAKPDLKLRVTGPDKAQRYDILVFGLEVTNTGAVELTDVKLIDELPAGLEHRPDEDKGQPDAPPNQISPDRRLRTWTIARLAPNQTRQVQYYLAAAGVPAGAVEHKAKAEAAAGAKAEGGGTITFTEPALEVHVEAPPRRPATLPARVLIRLTNRGPRVLQNIVVTDLLPDPVRVETLTGGGQAFSDRVQWIVRSLSQNEEKVLELLVRRPEGGPVRHQVTAVYRGLAQKAEAATEFDAAAGLAWDFTGTPATVEVNGAVTYTLTARNTGSAPATNVRPAVELPRELTLVSAEPKEHKAEGARVVFDPVTLPPNGRATFLVRAKAAQSSIGARVQAEVSADLYTSGLPVRRQEVTAIGGSDPAPPHPPAAAPAAYPLPVPPPPPVSRPGG